MPSRSRRFISGVWSSDIRLRLVENSELTLDKARQVADSLEAGASREFYLSYAAPSSVRRLKTDTVDDPKVRIFEINESPSAATRPHRIYRYMA